MLIGGLLKTGMTSCDMWSLDLDMVVNFIEHPQKYRKENVWWKKTLPEEMKEYTCRFAHTEGLIDN